MKTKSKFFGFANKDMTSFANLPEWASAKVQQIHESLSSATKKKRAALWENLCGYNLLLGELEQAQACYDNAEEYNEELLQYDNAVVEQLPPLLYPLTQDGECVERVQAAIFGVAILLLVFDNYSFYDREVDPFLEAWLELAPGFSESELRNLAVDALRRINLDGARIESHDELLIVCQLLLLVYSQKKNDNYTREGFQAALYLSRVHDLSIDDIEFIADRVIDSESEMMAREKAEAERNQLNYFAHNIKAGLGGLKNSVDFIQRHLSKKYDLSDEQVILDRFLVVKNSLKLTTELMDGYKLFTEDPEKLRNSIEADAINESLSIIGALEQALVAGFAENPFNQRLLLHLSGGRIRELQPSFFDGADYRDGSLISWAKENLPCLEVNIHGKDRTVGWLSYCLLFAVFSETIKNAFKHGQHADTGEHYAITLDLREPELHFICENPAAVGAKSSGQGSPYGGTSFVQKIVRTAGGHVVQMGISDTRFTSHLSIRLNLIASEERE